MEQGGRPQRSPAIGSNAWGAASQHTLTAPALMAIHKEMQYYLYHWLGQR